VGNLGPDRKFTSKYVGSTVQRTFPGNVLAPGKRETFFPHRESISGCTCSWAAFSTSAVTALKLRRQRLVVVHRYCRTCKPDGMFIDHQPIGARTFNTYGG
jgi:hypothetical protein